uniref:Ribonuclease H-like domain-containing protein n=1 Tax=Tanacetum cinerariifolium TaxID=118510 RepID=A0A699GZ15_TANCI|nr:ribonuclease H-like domain-containing protein [Tanacetum cinerariifolium]
MLTNIVKDNKRTRASTLKTELRSIQLGTLSMEAYFQKIDSLVTTLTSLDCVVNDEDVVHYAITGLLKKYNQVCGYMHHQTTFHDLKTVHSLLVAEEMRLKTKERPCFNFAKGSCRFGSECRYVHDPNAKLHDFGTSKMSNTSNTDALLVQLLEKLNLKNKDASTHGSTVTSTKDTPHISPLPVAYSTQHNSSPACYLAQPISNYSDPPGFGYPTGSVPLLQPAQYILQAQTYTPPPGPAQKSTTGPMGSGSTNTVHATLLPQAFTVRTLHDPNIRAWNIDTEKPLVLCHACQLGKHVRLPFDSSSTIVTSCFDIIHSGVWTSPIPSLSSVTMAVNSTTAPFINFLPTMASSFVSHALRHLNKMSLLYLDPIVKPLMMSTGNLLSDGTLSHYKARPVANGSTQLEGIDVDETFSAFVKPGTIRTVLSLATSRHWPVHQLDRSLYGLKQAPRAWFQQFASYITRKFAMTDLGSLNYFLGIFTRDSLGMFLSQKKYAAEFLSELVCLHMHDPREPHFLALKRILRYVFCTLDYGLQLFSSSTTDLVAYSDADWVGCPTTRRSTSGYCVFLGHNLLSWSAKRQPTLSCSSAEAEYRGVANAIAETCWLRNLLRKLHTSLSSATLFYCDNVSVVYLSSNPVQHQRTKHIEIDIHFVCDLVATGQVRVLHVPSRYQFTDIFTKGLHTALFEEFRFSLNIRCPLAQTAGEC